MIQLRVTSKLHDRQLINELDIEVPKHRCRYEISWRIRHCYLPRYLFLYRWAMCLPDSEPPSNTLSARTCLTCLYSHVRESFAERGKLNLIYSSSDFRPYSKRTFDTPPLHFGKRQPHQTAHQLHCPQPRIMWSKVSRNHKPNQRCYFQGHSSKTRQSHQFCASTYPTGRSVHRSNGS